jgi:haloalkane dehalogenase
VVLEEALVDYLLYYYRAPDIVASFFLEAVAGPLAPEVLAAYDAPFPDARYKAGLRQMTGLLPLTRNDPGAIIGQATMSALSRFERPFLTAYSDGDPATAGWEKVFQEWVPGAADQPHVRVEGAGHFLQEQKGKEVARIVADFIAVTPGPPPGS